MVIKTQKVLFVIGCLQLGGAERQMSLLATELIKRGTEVRLFCLEDTGPLHSILETSGVRIHGGGYDSLAPRGRKILLLMRAQMYLLWLAFAWRPQVLHAFLPLTNFMGALAGRLAGVRCIVTSRRALGTHQDRHPWWAKVDRLSNRFSTVITANSQAVVDDTVRRDQVHPTRLRLIYNGIEFPCETASSCSRAELRCTLGLENKHIAIVFVANLIHYKGHAELIDALAQISPRNPNLRLFLIGEDRGLGASLVERAERSGVGSLVTQLGRREDVACLLSAMDIGVMASHEEGFSNALLEKLAAGLPVVATAVGGNPEALRDMPGCVLVPPHDADGIACGIESILSRHDSLFRESAIRRRTVIERYSVESMVASYEQVYRQAIGTNA